MKKQDKKLDAKKKSSSKQKMEECEYCREKSSDVQSIEIYESPFGESHDVKLCEECEQNMEDTFFCDRCCRTIADSYGWRLNYKIVSDEDGYDKICASCYQDEMFENGQPASDFEGDQIVGDFYSTKDLKSHGFHEHASYGGIYHRKKMFEDALDLIDHGKKVIVNLERISVAGDEGSYSLWVKD